MSGQANGRPGFHAMMAAAAYAEEGLVEHALETLREGAGEGPRAEAGERGGLLAWLRPGARRPADRTA